MVARSQFPTETPPPQPAPAGAAGLRDEYQHLGRQLRRWLWGGAALLLALPLLWQLLPTSRQLVPMPTRGYRWLQAGTVPESGTTWVWALADSAGQARLLLSSTRGRTWLTRRLGVPAAQARALVLGWGSPWRGVLLGPRGALRVLPDVLHRPQQHTLLATPAVAAVALAADTQGHQLVLGDSVRGIWQSADAGKSWQQARPDSEQGPALPPTRHVLFDPVEKRFFGITSPYQSSEFAQTQTTAPPSKLPGYYLWKQTAGEGQRWTRTHGTAFTAATAPALYTGLAANGRLLLIYQDGSALQLSSTLQTTDPVEGRYRLFATLTQAPQALALPGGPGSPLTDDAAPGEAAFILASDSALLFEATLTGGRVRRWRLGSEPLANSQPPAPAAADTGASAAPAENAKR